MFSFNSSKRRSGRLETMLAAARSAPEAGRLSGETRSRILSESLRPARAEPLATLFTPTRRLVMAGSLPLVLAAVLLVGLDSSVRPPAPPTIELPRVAVVKQGGSVHFNISNGGKTHRVSRSTDPRAFEGSAPVELRDNAYVDPLDDPADLVFYRID